MTDITRYEMDVSYYWDNHDEDGRTYYVRECQSDSGNWVPYEDVKSLKKENEELNKRIAELELENLILREKGECK